MKKIAIAVVLAIVALTGCSKDDGLGTVSISFEEIDYDFDCSVEISTLENADIPIFSREVYSRSTEVRTKLLPGNYVVSVYSPNNYFGDIAFQLVADKTVDVWYDEQHKGHYEIR